VFGEQILGAVGTQSAAARVREHDIIPTARWLSKPTAQNVNRAFRKWSATFLAAFAQAVDVRACTEDDILPAQSGHLREA